MEHVTGLLRQNGSGSSDANGRWNYFTYLNPPNTYWNVPSTNVETLIHGYCTYVHKEQGIWEGKVLAPSMAQRIEEFEPVTFSLTLVFDDEKFESESARA